MFQLTIIVILSIFILDITLSTLNYKHRQDKGILDSVLIDAALGRHIGFTADIKKNRNSIILFRS